MTVFEQKQRKVLVQKEVLFVACIVLGIIASCNDIKNREIYFIRHFPEQLFKTLCVYSQDSISVLDTIFYSNISEFYRINNEKYSYIERGGIHYYLNESSLIIRDFAHNQSDTLVIENTDPGQMQYVISDKIYICAWSNDIFYIYIYDGIGLNKYYEFKPYPDSCIPHLGWLNHSKYAKRLAIICEVSTWPSPQNWNPNSEYNVIIVNINSYSHRIIKMPEIWGWSPILFDTDSTFFAITDLDIYKFNLDGNVIAEVFTMDNSSSEFYLIGYYNNRYLAVREVYIYRDSTNNYTGCGTDLFYLDVNHDFASIQVDSGVLGFEYYYDEIKGDLLYTKKINENDSISRLLSYSFESGNIDTIFTIEGEILGPQVRY